MLILIHVKQKQENLKPTIILLQAYLHIQTFTRIYYSLNNSFSALKRINAPPCEITTSVSSVSK